MPLDQPAKPDPVVPIDACLAGIAARARVHDETAGFPTEDIAALAAAGLLVAPLPPAFGGAGIGNTPGAAGRCADVLRRIGRASLVLGRLYEGHVNALRLVFRHGDADARQGAAEAARAGAVFAVWNTDPGDAPPLRVVRAGPSIRLLGRKILCSGAGHVRRALVTARDGDAVRMVLVPLEPGERADLSGWTAQGMRASATGTVDFTGIELPRTALVGEPGAYGRQPDFSAGAWRFAAVQTGGLEALAEALRLQHRRSGRGGDPHQAARFGEVALLAQTARLWVEAAAIRAEAAPDTDGAAAVAFVNLARTAVERAAMDAIALTQRSIGLQALLRPHDAERIARDLATYLRQPAPDRALTEAAAYALGAPCPIGDLWDVA